MNRRARRRALRRAIFRSLYGQVAAVDRRGVIVAVNRGWTRALLEGGGTARAAGVGVDYLDVCRRAVAAGDRDAQAALDALARVLAGHSEHERVEYPCATPSETRWYVMVAEPLDHPVGGALVSHIDITRRRHAEEEVQREREELAHALRVGTLGEQATSLAHELNQPLAAITTNAQAARRMLASAPDVDPEVRAALDEIATSAGYAAEVIRRLRALFKKAPTEPRLIDVAGVITAVVGLLHSELERRAIHVELALPPALPCVLADVVQLQQVILNVIVNAAEAMDETDAPRMLRVQAAVRDSGHVAVTVCDTGPGVPDSDLERIFDRFVTRKAEGLGMGLTISRAIVAAHGGRMWATRNLVRGLTVHVELPCPAMTGDRAPR